MKVEVVYVGLRLEVAGLGPTGRVRPTFLYGKEEVVWAIPTRTLLIGGRYEAEKGLGENFTISKRPKLLGSTAPKEEWLDADRAAKAARAKAAEEAKARKFAESAWPALKPLYERARKLSIWERYAFGQYVARLVVSGKEKKR